MNPPPQGKDTFTAIAPAPTAGQNPGGAQARQAAGKPLIWQIRLMALAALVGCVSLFALVRHLALSPALMLQWQANAQGAVELVGSSHAELRAHLGKGLSHVAAPAPLDRLLELRATDLQSSTRWILQDTGRERVMAAQAHLSRLATQNQVQVHMGDGSKVSVAPMPRGLTQLGLKFWALSALALLLYLVGVAVLLAKLRARNALFCAMALAQSGNLLLMAVQHVNGLGLPAFFVAVDLPLRTTLDIVTAAACLNAVLLPPLRPVLPWRLVASLWLAVIAVILALLTHQLAPAWAWTQGVCLLLLTLTVLSLTASHRQEPNPLALLLRRFASATLGTLLLLMAAVLAAGPVPADQLSVAQAGSALWYVFLASVLLLMPFMSRSQQVMREFALLAGVSTVATSLDLLFIAAFSLSQFASLSLAVFLALGIYAASRQWLLNFMIGARPLTAERMFERLYRVVRAVETRPAQAATLMTGLLREMFEPLEVKAVPRTTHQPRIAADGAALMVPLPQTAPTQGSHAVGHAGAVLLRFAGRGRRMFTEDDARLASQVLEQIVRAVAYDQAVERGRSEERARIAQDLHDDIGARLLTLMYQAQNPGMEDYIRQTLKDLKTLTRGLAATDHHLSHAVGEWKADITQRLVAAHIELHWSFQYDHDLALSMTQWSALTRILRELVTNAIYHANAAHVTIEGKLEDGAFYLTVSDDGRGTDPRLWAHGLGLGGIRKRVKTLNGDVTWLQQPTGGVRCEVKVSKLTETS
jgi:signal transduction histidine kinase